MPAEAATYLPWLSPCAASLVALARAPTAAVWEEVRCDPGCVLLLVRHAPAGSPGLLWASLVQSSAALDAAARHLERRDPGFANWDHPALRPVHEASLACAHHARLLAERSGRCDLDSAWIAGLLAPLGWLAAASEQGGRAAPANLDGAAIARRLNVHWRLPAWLAAVTGHLGLSAPVATSLGADPDLFRVAQLAVTLARQQGQGLNLVVGAEPRELVDALGLTPAAIAEIRETPSSPRRPVTWEPPESLPLLPELLRLAAENHRLREAPSPEALHREVDALEAALIAQRADEGERLQRLKLAALAELAAGAGHEINNPLAVISGQAQYLLKRLPPCASTAITEGAAAATPSALEQRQLASALEKIVNQANRIHQTLTELMKFARPSAPMQRPLDVGGLLREVAASLRELAEQRQVRLVCVEPAAPLTLHADPEQAATALRSLLRNAIEAAPAEGWAGVRAEVDGSADVALVVEDSGPGPSAADCEHLFDPFYSGRKAGRGRGLGLPTAWRLAREHGGEVRHDAASQGPTRFILRLPQATGPTETATAEQPPVRNGANGCHLPSAIAS